MTQLFAGSESAGPERVRLVANAEYDRMRSALTELASLSVALENGVTDASLRRLAISAVRRALGPVTP